MAEEKSLGVPNLEAALQSSKEQASRLTAELSVAQAKVTKLEVIRSILIETRAKLVEVSSLLDIYVHPLFKFILILAFLV